MCPSIFVTCMGGIYPIKVEWKLLLVQQFSTPHFGQTTHEPSSFEIKSQSMGRPRSGLTDLAAMSRWTSGWWSGNIRCLLSKIPQRKSVRSFRRLASQRNNKTYYKGKPDVGSGKLPFVCTCIFWRVSSKQDSSARCVVMSLRRTVVWIARIYTLRLFCTSPR